MVSNDEESNTYLINVGVGQGKTTAANTLIRYYANQEDYIVIVACPFNTLIGAYYENITDPNLDDHIPEEKVYKMDEFDQLIGKSQEPVKGFNTAVIPSIDVSKYKVHVVTINLLLGNPGDTAFAQAGLKRDFLSELRLYCELNKKKVVIIFDEIHESIHNFKEELLFHLRTWNAITFRTLVLSATFTEPSIVACFHISYLCGHNVKIINVDRVKNQLDRLANLHLYFTNNNKNYHSGDLSELDFIAKVVSKYPKNIIEGAADYTSLNILSYSEKIAKAIYNMDYWDEAGLERQLITSKVEGHTFNEKLTNIGTTFKTGINIRDDNPLYIIVTPCISSEKFISKGEAGIFTDGNPSIIQAFARVRNGGDILVFMPEPKVLIEGEYLEKVKQFEPFRSKGFEEVDFHEYDEQLVLLQEVYKYNRDQVDDEIQKHDDEVNNGQSFVPQIRYPPFDNFIMERGQEYLVYTKEVFGRAVGPFIIWAAFNDQFQNCRLKSILSHKYKVANLNLANGNEFFDLFDWFKKNGLAEKIQDMSDFDAYKTLLKSLDKIDEEGVQIPVRLYRNNNSIKVTPTLERTVIKLLHFLRFDEETDFYESKRNFLLTNMKHSLGDEESHDEDLKKAYSELHAIGQELIQKINDQNIEKLFKKDEYNNTKVLDQDTLDRLDGAIESIKEKDSFISTKTYSLFRDKKPSDDLNAAYSFVKDLYWVLGETQRLYQGGRYNSIIGLRSIELENTLNFLAK